MNNQMWIAVIISFITVLCITPIVIRFAVLIGATDKPNKRKVHHIVMPRIGGLAIFIGVIVGYFVSGLYREDFTAISLGCLIIVILGFLDDLFDINAKIKLIVQIAAASIVVMSGLTIDFLHIPLIGKLELGILSIPVTIFWIVGITNAINLIDGLDGLAVGISSIVISTIALLAAINGKYLILMLSLIILGSTIAFLFYNFHPAKIFMGDIGALFLGYSVSILSLLGLYKSVTLFSFVVPIIILGVPVFDTLFAIFRRVKNRQPITAPDKGHLHHRLLMLGISHRTTVLLMYVMSITFSVTAIIFSSTVLWGTVLLFIVIIGIVELIKGNLWRLIKGFVLRTRRMTSK